MTLADELKKPAYAGLSDVEAAELINQQTVPVVGSVSQSWLMSYLGAQALLGPIQAKAADASAAASDPVRNACLACVMYLQSGIGTPFDLTDAQNVAMMDGLIVAGILTQQHKADVLAKATAAVPLHQTLGFTRQVDFADIRSARQ